MILCKVFMVIIYFDYLGSDLHVWFKKEKIILAMQKLSKQPPVGPTFL